MSTPPNGFPPQPGQPEPPQGAPVSFDFSQFDINAVKKFSPLQFVVAGAGILTFIFGLFPYYTIDLFGVHKSAGAFDVWPSMLGVLLALAGSLSAASSLFGVVKSVDGKSSYLFPLIGLGGGFLLILISWFWYPGAGDLGSLIGRGFGFYMALICSAAGAAVAAFNFLGSKGQAQAIAGFAPTGYGPVAPMAPGYPQPYPQPGSPMPPQQGPYAQPQPPQQPPVPPTQPPTA